MGQKDKVGKDIGINKQKAKCCREFYTPIYVKKNQHQTVQAYQKAISQRQPIMG